MSVEPEVTTRNELIYLLYQAAELEHSLLCQYLFTAFTMRQPGEGLTPDQARKVKEWSGWIYKVAIEEMLHLALACNLLTAVGGAPNLRRPNFPQTAKRYSLGIESELAPFNKETIERFKEWETPEWLKPPKMRAPILPPDRKYSTIGELYNLIDSAFKRDDAQKWFIGPKEAQIDNSLFPFVPPLIAITSPEKARAAIKLIIEEGEGTPPPTAENTPLEVSPESHYAVYSKILEELEENDFGAGWPVAKNPLYNFHYDDVSVQGESGVTMISFPETRKIGELFTATYDLMCQFLMRLFASTDETPEMLRTLATATMEIMTGALKPLGEILCRMPVDDGGPQPFDVDAIPRYVAAGPSFEMYSDTQPLPHMRSAWIFFHERLLELADYCQAISQSPSIVAFAHGPRAFVPITKNLPNQLFEVAAVLQSMVDRFERYAKEVRP